MAATKQNKSQAKPVIKKTGKTAKLPKGSRGVKSRNKPQVERDRVFVSECYLRGMTLLETQRKLQELVDSETPPNTKGHYIVSESMVKLDRKKVMDNWKKTQIENAGERVNIHRAQHEAARKAAWRAFVSSPDPKYLAEVRLNTKELRILQGDDQPTKAQIALEPTAPFDVFLALANGMPQETGWDTVPEGKVASEDNEDDESGD
jgi:ATP-dependent DNA ligase